MGGGTHEAIISMEFLEHERLNRPYLAKRSTLSGNFYVADITDWDMIMGYDFMVGNTIGALPHRATLVREDEECLTCVRFSCNLHFRFFQCKILIYVHTQKSTIPALFWTVLVSVDQEFL